jgi:hypothetical protein
MLFCQFMIFDSMEEKGDRLVRSVFWTCLLPLLLALQAADLAVVVNNIADCNGLLSSSFTSISIEAIQSLRV